jgi:hypothetical protein
LWKIEKLGPLGSGIQGLSANLIEAARRRNLSAKSLARRSCERNHQVRKPRTQENMRALVFKRYGGPDQVTFADVPRPVPKPDEILVQVHAAGLNPIDNKIRDGKMKAILRFSCQSRWAAIWRAL